MSDWNAAVIEEFRANGGKVGGQFEGAPLVLVHHHGRTSGKEYVAPMMYLPDAEDPDLMFVFASKAGAPEHPDWYWNLVSGTPASVEVGTESYPVTVTDLQGAERDAVFAKQAELYPGFAEYEEKTRGIRTIPVLALRRG
jgi:deazaflavin-dependent oxidoreductase (nitroreductase family)